MKVTRFEDLECRKEARKVVRVVYEAISQNPIWQRDVRLCGQIQAASVSVMSNIAEGFTQHTDKEFGQFLFIAMSSAAEIQSHLYVAVDQKYLSQESSDGIYRHAEKTSKIISGTHQVPPNQNETD